MTPIGGHPSVTAALARLALFRQARDVTEFELAAYSAKVAEELIRPEDAMQACRTLEREPRADGETAFPSLGTLLEACSRAARIRQDMAREDAIKRLPAPAHTGPEMTPEEAKAFVNRLHASVARIARGKPEKAS